MPCAIGGFQTPAAPPARGGGGGRGSEFGCQPGTINTTQAGQPPRRVWPRYPGPGQLRNLLRCAGAKPSGWDALHLPGTLLGPESLHSAPAWGKGSYRSTRTIGVARPSREPNCAPTPPHPTAQAHPLASFLSGSARALHSDWRPLQKPRLPPLSPPKQPLTLPTALGNSSVPGIFPGCPGLRGWVSMCTPSPPTGEKPRHADPPPSAPGRIKRSSAQVRAGRG